MCYVLAITSIAQAFDGFKCLKLNSRVTTIYIYMCVYIMDCAVINFLLPLKGSAQYMLQLLQNEGT